MIFSLHGRGQAPPLLFNDNTTVYAHALHGVAVSLRADEIGAAIQDKRYELVKDKNNIPRLNCSYYRIIDAISRRIFWIAARRRNPHRSLCSRRGTPPARNDSGAYRPAVTKCVRTWRTTFFSVGATLAVATTT